MLLSLFTFVFEGLLRQFYKESGDSLATIIVEALV